MEKVKKAILAEQEIDRLINEICNEIVAKIEGTKVEGVRKISDNPNCFAVSLSSIMATDGFILSPEYYSSAAQSELVRKKLNGCVRMSDIKKRLQECVEAGYVKISQTKYKLNPYTLSVLEDYLGRF